MDLIAKENNDLYARLNYEEALVKKYQHFSEICSDASLKEKCDRIAKRHMQHYTAIMKNLD